jgi:4-amino-4-deoxy-L-arabinose transferase-like glycosyltransferase/tetratricopeptide (TPR) repeat protein
MLVCGIFFLIGLLSVNQISIYTPDSARYLIWANSLAKAEDFKDATTPEPTRYVAHAPLYPILLAPSAFLFHNSVVAAKVTTLLIGCIAIFFFYWWLKQKVGESYALAGSIFLALNPLMVLYSTQILSDIPFAVCLILFFFLAEKVFVEQVEWKTEAVFIAVLIAAASLRDVGIALLLTATAYMVWKKQYRRAVRVFLIPLVFYLLWFIRNEVIVAGVENPAERNTQTLFMHLYTSSQASLFEELGQRLWSNLNVYINLVGKLLLMPDFSSQSYMVISTDNPLVAFLLTILPAVKYILIAATIGFSVIGIWQLRGSALFSCMVIFLMWYFIPILFYPVNDIRFLFPLVVILMYLSVVGVNVFIDRWRASERYKIIRSTTIVFLILLVLPNMIWLQSYIWNSWQYTQSPENFYEKLKEEKKPPEMFTKPLHLAATWIVQHSDSSIVILSRWKELAIWLQGRKLVESNPRLMRDLFYYQLRDYGVKYIVAVRWRAPIQEYETLFIQSDRFVFIPVYTVGNVDVYEVQLKKNSTGEQGIALPNSSIRSSYDQALSVLEDEPLKSEGILKELIAGTEGYTMVTFHIGVAKEFAGQLDSAAAIFENFRTLPQAGSYLSLTRYHLDLISQLKMALSPINSVQRPSLYQSLAITYWGLGYRKRAMYMMSQSLKADSQFYSALIVSTIFSLEKSDTGAAWFYLDKARSFDSSNVFVAGLTTIRKCLDTLRVEIVHSRQIELRLKIIKSYIAMRLRDDAIDDLQALLRLAPQNQPALQLLAELFEMKRRYEPALRSYKTILTIDSANNEVRQKVCELSARF